MIDFDAETHATLGRTSIENWIACWFQLMIMRVIRIFDIPFRWSGLKFIGISQRRRIYCRFPQKANHWFLVIQVSVGSILPKKSEVSECVSEGSQIIDIVKFNRIKTLVTLTKDRHFKGTENFDEKSKKVRKIIHTKNWAAYWFHNINNLFKSIPFAFKSIHFGIDCLHSFCSLRGTSMWIWIFIHKHSLTPSLHDFPWSISNWLKFHKQVLNLYPNQVCVVKMNVKKPCIMIRISVTHSRRQKWLMRVRNERTDARIKR